MIALALIFFFGVVFSQHKFDFVLRYETECTISGPKSEAGVPYNCSGKAQSNDIKTLISGKGDVKESIAKLTGSVSYWKLTGVSNGNVCSSLGLNQLLNFPFIFCRILQKKEPYLLEFILPMAIILWIMKVKFTWSNKLVFPPSKLEL